MSDNLADCIRGAIDGVTKKWTKMRRAEERRQRSRASREYIFSGRINHTEVADDILPDAYAHSSGDGKYTVSKRMFYYRVREPFAEMTGRPLAWSYFADTLLVQYLNRNKEKTASWKITADPRGTFIIPNAGHAVKIPCGTIQIDNYLSDQQTVVDSNDYELLRTGWPSLAGGQRYKAILYIEKETFAPMLEEAKIAERFDVAILSCKGQSVVAARKLVDHVCYVGSGVPLLVVHDFDKAGFEIAQRLTKVADWAWEHDREVYRFENDIDVTDLGLKLADVEKYALATERTRFKGGFASDTLCTPAEQEYLRSNRRVELNAFTAPQFIEWIQSKLITQLGTKRLVPSDEVLLAAWRRAMIRARLNRAIEDAYGEIEDQAGKAKLPRGLRTRLQRSKVPWDEALYREVEGKLNDEDEDW